MDNNDVLGKIYEKVEKISDDIGDLKITSVKHDENLKEHMKRADFLENLYLEIKNRDIEPLKTEVNKFKGAVKFVTLIASLGSFITLMIKLFHK